MLQIYVIARYITYPNKSNSKSIHRSTTSLDADNSQSTLLATDANLLKNTLRIPESGDLSGASTPERRDVALAEAAGDLDEGATLNCLAERRRCHLFAPFLHHMSLCITTEEARTHDT